VKRFFDVDLMWTKRKKEIAKYQPFPFLLFGLMWTIYFTNSSTGIFLWVVPCELRQDAVGSSSL
jgi:hypothetical protein